MDALGVQKLPDDIGGLQVADRGNILPHGRIVVMLCIEVVPVPPLNLGYCARLRLRHK